MTALSGESGRRRSWSLGGLFRRRQPVAREIAAPPGYRIYAVGDIHGRADCLKQLLENVRRDLSVAPEKAVVVFLGDYVDRGVSVKETLEILATDPVPEAECHFLCGNHEAAMLQFLETGTGLAPWLTFGGEATLLSYEVSRPKGGYLASDVGALRKQFEEKIPDHHRDFLTRLEASVQFGELFFAHAGVRPGVRLEEQSSEDLMRIREPFLSSTEDFGAVVVHGHSVTDRPEIHGNRVAVDTGAYASGLLTAAVFTPDGVDFLANVS